MVVELPNTAELVVLNSDDEPIDEELQEDLEVQEPKAEHNFEDTESAVFGDNTSSSFDSGKEPRDEFDFDYNPSRIVRLEWFFLTQ